MHHFLGHWRLQALQPAQLRKRLPQAIGKGRAAANTIGHHCVGTITTLKNKHNAKHTCTDNVLNKHRTPQHIHMACVSLSTITSLPTNTNTVKAPSMFT